MALFPIIFPLLGSVAFLAFFAPQIGVSSGPSGVPFHAGNVRNPAVKSFFLFVPLYVARLAVFRFSDFEYSLQSLYLRYLFLDYLGLFVLIGGLAFFMNRAVRQEGPLEQYIGYLTFFTVYVVLFSVADAFLHDGYWTVYELFLRPVAMVVLLALYPMAITRADTATGGGWAVLYLVIAPFLCAIPAMLAEWLHPGAAILSAAGCVALAAGAIWWELFRNPISVSAVASAENATGETAE
ncbi:MAG: hypothetical protein PF508_16400 [Spirochaeta sp.]|jgi:hypothetical protein|nr:hypothetical protein [Spirochaeta sp.]